MSKGSRPFHAARYIRPGIRLVRLRIDQADFIAQQLANMDPWRALGYSQPGLYTYLVNEDPALHRYALEYAGELAGIIAVRDPWLFGPHLELLAIFPAYQGVGIGGEVIEWLRNEAQPHARNLWVVVSAFNTDAQRFYRRHGFQEIASLAELIAPGYDELLMRKPLT